MSRAQNIVRIKVVYDALGDMANKVVFVGGATVALYADRPVEETRPTDDVDIIIELLNYHGYTAVEEQLRAKGFENDMESGVICRYRIQGVVVDIMPTHTGVLGFANRWYPDGYTSSTVVDIGDGYHIRIFTAPYLLATKLEAYRDRGKGDGRMSDDFEDIVFVLNSRRQVWDELEAAPDELKTYLREAFGQLLAASPMEEWVSAHLDFQDQKRVTLILAGLEAFVERDFGT